MRLKERKILRSFRQVYPSDIASMGHADAHAPHEMHLSASISYLSPFSEMASLGQVDSQLPHAIHSSLILYAIGIAPPCIIREESTFFFPQLHCNTFSDKCNTIFAVNFYYFILDLVYIIISVFFYLTFI